MEETNVEAVKENIPEVKTEVKTESTQAEQQETQEQINWRKFREAREKERKEKESWEKKAKEKEAELAILKEAMEALTMKETKREELGYSKDQEEESEEDLLAKKIEEKLAAKEKEREEKRKKEEQSTYPQRLRQDYNDFNDVVTPENLDYIEYHFPEIATPFRHMPDGYDKWSSVYRTVKKLMPNHSNAKKDQEKAVKNLNKPQSPSSPGLTQTGDQAPVYLDEKRRQANWERMQKVIRGG